MRQILYVDNENTTIPLPLSYRRIRLGERITIDGAEYEAWYSEDCGTHTNIRVEKVDELDYQPRGEHDAI
jgi:hypothetical protein